MRARVGVTESHIYVSFHSWGRSLENIHREMGEKMGDGGALERAGGVARAGGLPSPCERST